MKADVYTAFLTHKVKVFATKKDVKPFVISRRLLRRATPFLLASAMTFTACSSRDNHKHVSDTQPKDEYTAIYQEVVQNYHLTSLQDKEPFSQDEINQMIMKNNPAPLYDTNFNHLPENTQNFWNIIQNGIDATKQIQHSPNLSPKQKKEYQIVAFKMLSQMSRVKGTVNELDIYDYNNLKTFLYFEKVLQYGDDYNKVHEKEDGLINEKSEIFGRYYKDYENLENKVQKFDGVRKFAQELYLNNEKFMISYQDSAQANKISKEFLASWLKHNHVTDKNLWYFTSIKEDEYTNSVFFWHNRGRPVELSVGIDATGNLDDGDFSPVGSIIIHELQHVMQKKPASLENPEDNRKADDDDDILFISSLYDFPYIAELGPTLYSLVLEDRIYKQIKGIDKNKVMDYSDLKFGHSKVNLGEVAVWFGNILDKYPEKSIDKILAKDEVILQINQWGLGQGNSLNLSKSKGR